MVLSVHSDDEMKQSANFARSIEIGSFRGLKDVHLEDLSQVNLLVGGNNSGKTSILEAIAVLYAGNDLTQWLDVSFVREVRTFLSSPNSMSVLDTISWMFPSNDAGLWEHDGAGEILLTADTLRGHRRVRASISAFRGFLNEEEIKYSSINRENSGEPVEDHGIEISIDFRAPRFLTIFVAAQQCVWR
jgi:predicted ATP-dependent endonuclease of OLD family